MNYMIVGLYPEENGKMQRFAESLKAANPDEAEELFAIQFPDVIIAGVLEDPNESLICVDTKNESHV